MPDNTREELKKRIGEMKPNDDQQLPLKDLLSHLEMEAILDALQSEITKALQVPHRYTADGRGWIYAPDVDSMIAKAKVQAQERLLNELEEVIHQPHSTYEILEFMRAKRKEIKDKV